MLHIGKLLGFLLLCTIQCYLQKISHVLLEVSVVAAEEISELICLDHASRSHRHTRSKIAFPRRESSAGLYRSLVNGC